MMKKLAPYFVVAFLSVSACAPPSIQTPAGKTAYTADQIVLRVNELENAAIQANATGGLDVRTTKTLVEFAVAADQTLKVTPAGWQTTVGTAWAQAKRSLPPITNAAVSAAMSGVDLVLAAFGGN